MENSKQNHLAEEGSSEALPSLIKAITSNEVAGFDSVEEHQDLNNRRLKSTLVHPLSTSIFGIEAAAMENESNLSKPQRTHSVSISMPPSPVAAHLQNTNRVLFRDEETVLGNDDPNSAANVSLQTKQAKFYSQPMPKGCALNENITSGTSSELPVRNPRIDKLKDKRFDSFKTWSGRLERQLSNLRGKHHEESEQEPQPQHRTELQNLPVDRYFDALEGPELDTLRASEEILLPEDKKWPFLLRFPISSFGICLGVSSQAIMWKALASSASTKFLHVSPDINLVLCCREYYHPIRVNFFFAPWIALLFLALGAPPSVSQNLHASLWYILMTPIFCLELKIYGQWMSEDNGGFPR
ncbi:UNVERIFIED_CONTAM: S-type anion channel SLAH3 [Sesamum latifolium]|uniref:S-type anion channel SLAH3 n=1 Tax=Sesamum latifolium TaxID=2727402 RepID=A0AAW2T7U9_9LAMI